MVASELESTDLLFGRLSDGGNVFFNILNRLTLQSSGRIDGAAHANETTWRVIDGALTFHHRSGAPTTCFDARFPTDARIKVGCCRVAPFKHFICPYLPLRNSGKRLLYLIASHVNFERPLHSLLAQLRKLHVPEAQIWVTIAQAKRNEICQCDGITFSHVTENAYEYTPQLDIARRDIECDYVFLLHDTCQVGAHFHELVQAQPVSFAWDYMSVATTGKFNIGLYRKEFLVENLPFLKSLSGICKRTAVQIELNRDGQGFRNRARIATNFLNGKCISTGFHNMYGAKWFRKGMYLPGADIHKFFGRWRQVANRWRSALDARFDEP